MTPHTFINADNDITVNINEPIPYIDVKWPGMLVLGKKVTKEQARDIIFKTIGYYISSNDDEFTQEMNVLLGNKNLKDMFIERETKEKLKILDLHFLSNSRIASSWIFGFKGWVDWDGNIFSNNYNIGKWPNVNHIMEEWSLIARTFPYLDLRCQLLNHEINEDLPNGKSSVITAEFVIKDGTVSMFCPDEGETPMLPDVSQEIDFSTIRYRKDNIGIERLKTEFELYKKQNGID